jgi:hypothetical protein
MKHMKLISSLLTLLLVGILSYANSREDGTAVQKKKIAFMRLTLSDASAEDVDTDCKQLQSAIANTGRWEIMDFSLTQELITKRGGRVICDNLQYAIINGKLLKVDYVCFGNVATIGKKVFLNVKIANVATGKVIANVSKCYVRNTNDVTNKVIPVIGNDRATVINNKKTTVISRDRPVAASLETASERQSSSEGRRYRSSGNEEVIEPADKLAFAYFDVGKNIGADDALRYSYQLQSYLAGVGGCTILSPDEMQQLTDKHGVNSSCKSKESAVKTGRLLGVKYMGFVSIHKNLNRFTIKVTIIDVKNDTTFISEKRSFNGKEPVFFNEIIPQLAFKIGEVFERTRINGRRVSRT